MNEGVYRNRPQVSKSVQETKIEKVRQGMVRQQQINIGFLNTGRVGDGF